METDRRARTPLRTLIVVLAAVFLALLAGCSGGVREPVAQAVEEAAASTATAALSLDLEASGRLTAAATSTALEDALKELGKTRTTVLELSPTVQHDRTVRHEALAALDDCVSAVSAASEAVASEDGRPTLAEAGALLASAGTQLEGLENRWDLP